MYTLRNSKCKIEQLTAKYAILLGGLMRKLASVQTITAIRPIPNADAIEVARILGWDVVIKKGQFQVGDSVVYVEIDSILPERPEFEFLRPQKFRIRTLKLRGQISQGICFPLSILIPKWPTENPFVFVDGDDVTDLLEIKIYEPEIPTTLHGLVEGVFPTYLVKTDETRVQSDPRLLDEFKGLTCYVTVKLDGTSSTFSHNNGELKICGRNYAYKLDSENAYGQIFTRYNLGEKLKSVGNYAIQGEVCGPSIQSNPLKLKQIDFFAFNAYDIDKGRHLDYLDFIALSKELGVKTVPIISDTFVFDHTVEQLLELAKGQYEGTNTPREGIVIRPLVSTYSYVLYGRLSMKVLNNNYLLKFE